MTGDPRFARGIVARRIRRVTGRDDGQVVSALVVLLSVGMLFFAVKVILPVGEATDKRSQAQVAADAAALAAAETVADATASRWSLGFRSRFTGAGLVVCDGFRLSDPAGAYAGKNGAEALTAQCVGADRVEVTVRLNQLTEGGEVARARAVASLGIDWIRDCRWVRIRTVPVPVPTTTTTTTTRPTTTITTTTTTTRPPPPPTPDVIWELRCKGVAAEFRQSGRPPFGLTFQGDEAALERDLKERVHLTD
jgi:hypothetical protein